MLPVDPIEQSNWKWADKSADRQFEQSQVKERAVWSRTGCSIVWAALLVAISPTALLINLSTELGVVLTSQLALLALVAVVWRCMWTGQLWARWLFALFLLGTGLLLLPIAVYFSPIAIYFWSEFLDPYFFSHTGLLLAIGLGGVLSGWCLLLHPRVRQFLRFQRELRTS